MIRTETLLTVADVRKSAEWYIKLLNCKPIHGGDTYEILIDTDGTVILCLHKLGEQAQANLNTGIKPANRLIILFRVTNLMGIWKNAKLLKATIEIPLHLNEKSGREEFSLLDRDGYYISITT